MRKLFSFFLALTLSVGLWAQETPEQQAVITAIETEVGGSTDTNILVIANAAKEEIGNECRKYDIR